MIPALFVLKHGPLGSDGMPVSHKFESLGDWDIENIPNGTKLGCFESLNTKILELQAQLDSANKLVDLFIASASGPQEPTCHPKCTGCESCE